MFEQMEYYLEEINSCFDLEGNGLNRNSLRPYIKFAINYARMFFLLHGISFYYTRRSLTIYEVGVDIIGLYTCIESSIDAIINIAENRHFFSSCLNNKHVCNGNTITKYITYYAQEVFI
ncbi:MAG: hypothetical protein K0S61_579 [Anaerocolumna sp.]|jgi:hypothetical protein|nr:hypothetical protein [Anaerocolumna sp.]